MGSLAAFLVSRVEMPWPWTGAFRRHGTFTVRTRQAPCPPGRHGGTGAIPEHPADRNASAGSVLIFDVFRGLTPRGRRPEPVRDALPRTAAGAAVTGRSPANSPVAQ